MFRVVISYNGVQFFCCCSWGRENTLAKKFVQLNTNYLQPSVIEIRDNVFGLVSIVLMKTESVSEEFPLATQTGREALSRDNANILD